MPSRAASSRDRDRIRAPSWLRPNPGDPLARQQRAAMWKSLREQQRSELLYSRLMAVYGVWQRDAETGGEVRHLIAKRLKDLTPLLGGLSTRSREFH